MKKKVLLVGLGIDVIQALRERLSESGGFKIVAVPSAFEAGLLVESDRPHCVVIDFSRIHYDEAGWIGRGIRNRSYKYGDVVIIGLEEAHAPGVLTQHSSCDEIFFKPFDIALLTERVRKMIAERKANA